MKKNKNILITLFYADGLHGGVKYSAEIGNYFNSLGYNVYCVGVITDNFTIDFMKQNNVNLVNIKDFDNSIKYDLVWAHHFPIFPYLVRRGLKYGKLINSCISEFLLIEKPLFCIENVDLFLALTPQLRSFLIKNYGIKKEHISFLPNTAPDTFFELQKTVSTKIKKIAVISNHPPKEVIQAGKDFKHYGISVDFIGGSNPIEVTAELLSNYDVVISIGKTVQYCLAMGIPIYNYDHFGGSGYITPENIDVELQHNFSGRSFHTKKTAQVIISEIINQYQSALSNSIELKKIAEKQFKLSERIGGILNLLNKQKGKIHLKETSKNRLIFDYCDFIVIGNIHHKQEKKKRTGLSRLFYHIRTMKF